MFTSKNELLGDFAGFWVTPLRTPAPEALSVKVADLIKEMCIIGSTGHSAP